MRRIAVFLALAAASGIAQPPATRTLTLQERLSHWKPVDMPFHAEGLSNKERQMVEKLVEACRLLDQVYWLQSDRAGFELYRTTRDPLLKRLLGIMGGRWDLLDENRP